MSRRLRLYSRLEFETNASWGESSTAGAIRHTLRYRRFLRNAAFKRWVKVGPLGFQPRTNRLRSPFQFGYD